MSVVIDPGEVDCVCSCVMDFMMFLAYFWDNNHDTHDDHHYDSLSSTLFRPIPQDIDRRLQYMLLQIAYMLQEAVSLYPSFHFYFVTNDAIV